MNLESNYQTHIISFFTLVVLIRRYQIKNDRASLSRRKLCAKLITFRRESCECMNWINNNFWWSSFKFSYWETELTTFIILRQIIYEVFFGSQNEWTRLINYSSRSLNAWFNNVLLRSYCFGCVEPIRWWYPKCR